MNAVKAMEGMETETRTDSLRRKLWLFYLFGEGADDSKPLHPVMSSVLEHEEPLWPLLIGESAQSLEAQTMSEWLSHALESLEQEGIPCQVLLPNRRLLAGMAADQMDEALMPLPRLMERLSKTFPKGLDLSDAASRALEVEFDALLARLPQNIDCCAPRRDTPLALYLRMLEKERSQRRRVLVEKVRQLVNGLAALVQLARDHSAEGHTPQRLASSLGSAGSRLINPERMAHNLPQSHGTEACPPERRARLESCRRKLEHYLDHQDQYPDYYLLHQEGHLPPITLHGGTGMAFSDCLEAGAAVYEILVKSHLDLLLTCRVAALEILGEFDAELHDSVLMRMSWDCLTEEELRFLPAVTVVENAETVRAELRGSYSDLLGSGLPVHVLLSEERPERERIRHDLAYQAVSFREVLVNATSPVRPLHLLESFRQMIAEQICSVTVIACPNRNDLSGEAFLQSRITPLYRYNATRGISQASRFSLEDNPQQEQPWPVYDIRLESEDETFDLEMPFTFADAVALCPSLRSHFLLIPRWAWNDEDQVPMAAYEGDTTRSKVPYIWVTDGEGTLHRAAVTRALAQASMNRSRFWQSLQELAGINNEYALRAAREAREQSDREARQTIEQMEADHRDELERVRRNAGRETMERLAQTLLNGDMGTIAIKSKPAPVVTGTEPPPVAEPPPETVAVKEVPVEDEYELFNEEPYIDTELCTSCNECTNLNPVMFKYNGDKQAMIADAKAGTFRELVTAAEKCPAGLIHPGVPRPDDTTATPELIGRAARFN